MIPCSTEPCNYLTNEAMPGEVIYLHIWLDNVLAKKVLHHLGWVMDPGGLEKRAELWDAHLLKVGLSLLMDLGRQHNSASLST